MAEPITLEPNENGEITLECNGEVVTVRIKPKPEAEGDEEAIDAVNDAVGPWGRPTSYFETVPNKVLVVRTLRSFASLETEIKAIENTRKHLLRDENNKFLFILKLEEEGNLKVSDLALLRDLARDDSEIQIVVSRRRG